MMMKQKFSKNHEKISFLIILHLKTCEFFKNNSREFLKLLTGVFLDRPTKKTKNKKKVPVKLDVNYLKSVQTFYGKKKTCSGGGI